jgi:hypothetical protein
VNSPPTSVGEAHSANTHVARQSASSPTTRQLTVVVIGDSFRPYIVGGTRSPNARCTICHNYANESDWEQRRQMQAQSAASQVRFMAALQEHGVRLRRLHLLTYDWHQDALSRSAPDREATFDGLGEELRSLYSNLTVQPTLRLATVRSSRSNLLSEGLYAVRLDALASDAVLTTRFDLEFKDPVSIAASLTARWDQVVLPFRSGNHYPSHLRCANAVAQGTNVPRLPDTFYWIPGRYKCMLQWAELFDERLAWYVKRSNLAFLSDEFANSNSAVVSNSVYVLNTRPEATLPSSNHTLHKHGCNSMAGPWSAHRAYDAHPWEGAPKTRWTDTVCSDVWRYHE